jgi:hypothetical protein
LSDTVRSVTDRLQLRRDRFLAACRGAATCGHIRSAAARPGSRDQRHERASLGRLSHWRRPSAALNAGYAQRKTYAPDGIAQAPHTIRRAPVAPSRGPRKGCQIATSDRPLSYSVKATTRNCRHQHDNQGRDPASPNGIRTVRYCLIRPFKFQAASLTSAGGHRLLSSIQQLPLGESTSLHHSP